MKKNLFFHFSVLAMLIVLISACSSKKSEYTNVIPSDASQVIAVNLKSLADKAGTKDKETKEALQKLTDALKSDMNAATFQQMEAVLKDPAKSGVDVHAPIYIFNAPSFPYTTMVAKVQNEDDLLKLLEVTEKEQISSHVAEADGYSFVQINKQALLAFTPTTLMVVNYTGTSQLEKVKEGIPALLKQTGENSINSNTAFKKMQKQDGDINMLISPSSLLSAYANPLNYGISKSIDLCKTVTVRFCHMADYLFFLRNFQKLQQIILTLNLGYHGGVGERGSVEDINRRIDVHSRFGRVFQYSLQLLESSCIHIAFQGICQLLQCFFSLFIFGTGLVCQ